MMYCCRGGSRIFLMYYCRGGSRIFLMYCYSGGSRIFHKGVHVSGTLIVGANSMLSSKGYKGMLPHAGNFNLLQLFHGNIFY